MFGYLIADRQQMSEEEKRRYNAYHCGLCRALRAGTGLKGSALLSYEMTFLYMLLSAVYDPETISGRQICFSHPIRKQLYFSNELEQYVASMSILLGYEHLNDDCYRRHDHRAKQLASSFKEKLPAIAALYPRQADSCRKTVAGLHDLTKRNEINVQLACTFVGELGGNAFSMLDDEWSDALYSIGFYMAKSAYIIDSYIHLDKDLKSGNYNPLILKKNEDPEGFDTCMRATINSQMNEALKNLECLPVKRDISILRNVLTTGVSNYISDKPARRTAKEF